MADRGTELLALRPGVCSVREGSDGPATPCWRHLPVIHSSVPSSSHAQAAPFTAGGPSYSRARARARATLSLTGPIWGCPTSSPSWSPSGAGALAKAPQHITPFPVPVLSHQLCTQGLQTHPGAQRRSQTVRYRTEKKKQ